MQGTTYVYDTFFRPYLSRHETQIDRHLLELHTRTSDIASLFFQRLASYGQSRFYEVLEYVASQSNTSSGSRNVRVRVMFLYFSIIYIYIFFLFYFNITVLFIISLVTIPVGFCKYTDCFAYLPKFKQYLKYILLDIKPPSIFNVIFKHEGMQKIIKLPQFCLNSLP